MRDLALVLFVLGSLPFILRRPWIGCLMWIWLSIMNPHRLTWSYAQSLPFAQIVAIVTLIAMVFSREHKKLPLTPMTFCLALFLAWTGVTTLTALDSVPAQEMFQRVFKIQLMNFVVLAILHTRQHIQLMVWVIVGSMTYYSLKGGLFTLLHGGESRVWGPAGTFIQENNALALSIIITIPLMVHLFNTERRRWLRWGMLAAIGVSGFAVLGSHSRGALIAVAGMLAFLWIKSRRKLPVAIALALMVPVTIGFMPDKWMTRMESIGSYEEDRSAQGRINAWMMTINLVKDRPVLGGGFDMYNNETFARWAPNPTDIRAAHSIYFQVLGEHGFPGLTLFLLIWLLGWRNATWVIGRTRDSPQHAWANGLCRMVQVSLVGYLTGGAFLSLAYFDLPYFIVGMALLTRVLIERELRPMQDVGARNAPKRAIDGARGISHPGRV